MGCYKFVLIQSDSPIIKGNKIVIDSKNKKGIVNFYKVFFVKKITIFKLDIVYFRYYMGTVRVWCPYKTFWNKNTNRVSKPYWGRKNSPLMNLWIVLNSNDSMLRNELIFTKDSTQSVNVKILKMKFKSTTISKSFKKNQSFFINQVNK